MPAFFTYYQTLLSFLFFIGLGFYTLCASPLEDILALNPNLEAGEKTYRLCAACHGKDGLGQQNGEFPSIAGQHKTVILKGLIDIQTKKRINPTMYPFTDLKTLGGLQGMADIAAYTATLEAKANNIKGAGTQRLEGQKLYEANCISCHGTKGEGNADLFYPRLSQQHYPYLVRELSWIRDGIRKNSNPAMKMILQGFSDEDIQSTADYLSRLK